ncbi:glycerophosphodiester phosphodiesterase [Limnofasciculus baicalensis]|uniref:Glycerophosphodiester phosphodiesterase n=1 Tax=Limnofasciculus baicalensis BBK-W-15 TaxID=2699891 RepID=A0AAE3KQL9_9CYAN|nr:glycerophosphodiester phosphodiesterase [Limnofasciculus baicalensis]MCP2731986.1 glycerophosphodiester phosphodiesterase [Limnofasciculus baicalensis BBK-W-15]
MMKKLIIAHRGFHNSATENTIEAYQKAIEIGVDGIEFDVRKTKDDILISHHDEIIYNKYISNLTYEQINKIAADKGFTVPTVEEVLKITKGKVKLFVELKEEGYEDDIINLLLKYLNLEEFIVISFNVRSLKLIKSSYADVKTGLLLRTKKAKLLGFIIKIFSFLPSSIIFGVNPDILLPHVDGYSLELLKFAQREQKNIVLWTVNDEVMIGKFLKDNIVQGIITDSPDVAIFSTKLCQ